MDTLTLSLIAVVVVLLLTGILIGRKLSSPAAKSHRLNLRSDQPRLSRMGNVAQPPANRSAPAPEPASARVAAVSTVETLEIRLINCFGGNRGAMVRTIQFERGKFPHLTEVELREKMLYDFERGH
jgi:hypothetical protein